MTYFYDKEFFMKLNRKKKLHFAIIISIMSVMLISNAILIVVFADKPFGSGLRNLFQTISYVITVLLTFISGIYYEITYVPIKKYYIKISELLLGKRELSDVTVLRVYNDLFDNSSVKFKKLDVLVWFDIQNDYVEREILIDANLDISFNENQMVKVLTCGNILLGYEVK